MTAKGWAIPPNGALLAREPLAHVYEMSDGVEYTAAELLTHRNNVYGVSGTTLRMRLANGVRDIDTIFERRLPRTKAHNTAATSSFNRRGLPL